MFQEFYKTTIISKYIKYLLSYTPLPLYPTIEHNQHMIEGCIYIYKDKVLKCTKSGHFSAMAFYDSDFDHLYASDFLYVQDKKIEDYMTIIEPHKYYRYDSPLVVTDSLIKINKPKLAEYELLNNFIFGEDIHGVTQRFVSNVSYYDPTTHKILGEYLRLLKNQFDVNLMPLYNCFTGEIVTNVSLNPTNLTLNNYSIDGYKTMLVPIKFNKTYTISIDCSFPIMFKSIVYNEHLITNYNKNKLISDMLGDNARRLNSSKFSTPFKFRLNNIDRGATISNGEKLAKYLQQFEENLYLAIQVPVGCDSTLVVLEGDYTSMTHYRRSDMKITTGKIPRDFSEILTTLPSLMTASDGRQHPFSSKLISYLIGNTIDNREYIDDNVLGVENKINYTPKHQGIWDNQLRYILFNKYLDICEKFNLNREDILGFVDIDIEDAVRKGYIKYE